ncbi:MAG: hypothetical protein U0169_11185 [Polyangiaceae bacterium]
MLFPRSGFGALVLAGMVPASIACSQTSTTGGVEKSAPPLASTLPTAAVGAGARGGWEAHKVQDAGGPSDPWGE